MTDGNKLKLSLHIEGFILNFNCDLCAGPVKLLIENSIDASATRIEVCISDGGKSFIQVKDNGWGMTKSELPLSVCRHATSKLVDNNLSKVNTYGFRGEALSSIASVSHISISTSSDGTISSSFLGFIIGLSLLGLFCSIYHAGGPDDIIWNQRFLSGLSLSSAVNAGSAIYIGSKE